MSTTPDKLMLWLATQANQWGTPQAKNNRQLLLHLHVHREGTDLPAQVRKYTSRPMSSWTLAHLRGLISGRLRCDLSRLQLATMNGEVLAGEAVPEHVTLGELDLERGLQVTILKNPQPAGTHSRAVASQRRARATASNCMEMRAYPRKVLSNNSRHMDVLFQVRVLSRCVCSPLPPRISNRRLWGASQLLSLTNKSIVRDAWQLLKMLPTNPKIEAQVFRFGEAGAVCT